MRLSTILVAVTSLAAVLFLCPTVHAQRVPLGDFAHPDSKLLIGVDWAKAKSSPAGRMLARRMTPAVKGHVAAGPGTEMLDLLDLVDRVLISSTGGEAAPGGAPPFVMALEGRVDRARIKKLLPAGTATERFRGTDLFVPPKAKAADPLLALLDERTALVADRRSLATVLDGRRGVADGELAERAATLASECEIWMVATAPVAEIAGGALPQAGQFDDILGMDFGLNLSAGLGLRANVQSRDDRSAQGLATLVQMVAAMASQDQNQGPETAKLLRSLDVKADGAAVRIRFDVSAAQLEKSLAQAAAPGGGRRTLESFLGIQPSGQLPPGLRPAVKGTTAGPMVPAAATAPPAEPQKRTIRIVGGDDGEKEISYTTGGRKD